MTSRFLQAVRPFMSITPEVVKPTREVHFNEKMVWTFVALVIYFVMASTPIIGADLGEGDPFAFMRTITASTQGSLAELGIGPIVTAGLIMQILVGSKIINVNMGDPEERSLYTGAQKVMSVAMTIIEASAFLIGGTYGTNLNTGTQLAIIAQLLAAGIIIILLDEMIQKGWGLGSGISLFIAGGVGLQIFQGLFAAQAVGEGSDFMVTSFRGIALAFFAWATQRGPIEAIGALFLRYNPAENLNLPSLSLLSVIATIVVFIIVIYFESMRIEIPISYAQYKGIRSTYPIKLLYVSNIPVILTSAVFADIYFIAQMVWNTVGRRDSNNPIAAFLGTFRVDEVSSQYVPTGGLVYFLTPPRSLIGDLGVFDISRGLDSMAPSLIRALIYAAILIILSVIFSVMWLETAGMGPRDVANQFLQSGMQMPGWRRSKKIVERRLEMYIPTIAIIGGLFIGSLAAFADFLGAIGSGMGILLSVSIMRQYFELISKERVAEMNPALRGFLGIS
ncbi:MAG: preprotein translocase subunit SecY [Candidatus Heimdallarchaeota archaeon]|nr:MAG: preprotein translocase subunit SecY [Candidatus Heimdallarchaeota archaeon]